jgi:hypothetical protein
MELPLTTSNEPYNLYVYVICFKTIDNGPDEIYFCSDRMPEPMDFYIDATKTDFQKLQLMGTQDLSNRCKKVEASTKVLFEVPLIPAIFADNYFKMPKENRMTRTYYRTKN